MIRRVSSGTLLLLFAAPLGAQAARGDSLLAAGRPFAAENVYYEAARLRPREPAARLSLGRYLAARGAVRVGAVLMEEARYFGGDPATVAVELAPAYERLGDWKALGELPSPPVAAGERERARWLAEHAPSRSGPDETTVPYALDAPHPLGRISLRIGNVDVVVDVDAAARGLVLPPFLFSDPHTGVRTFGPETARWSAVAAAVRAGAMTLGNVPVTADATARTPRIGLDLLGTLAPTFDAGARTVTLRKAGRAAAGTPGTRIPTLQMREGAFLVVGGTAVPLGSARGVATLAGARWTWDARRGTAVVTR